MRIGTRIGPPIREPLAADSRIGLTTTAMNLTYPITLVQPGAETYQDDGTVSTGDDTEHSAWAARRDYQGGESLDGGVDVSVQRTEFTVRAGDFDGGTTKWLVRDSGVDYRIHSITRTPSSPRFFRTLHCSARE